MVGMRLKACDISALAPPAPPCFVTRLQWLEYLATAQECKGDRWAKPFIEIAGRVEPNPLYNWCRQCMPSHEVQMIGKGLCKPHPHHKPLPLEVLA